MNKTAKLQFEFGRALPQSTKHRNVKYILTFIGLEQTEIHSNRNHRFECQLANESHN